MTSSFIQLIHGSCSDHTVLWKFDIPVVMQSFHGFLFVGPLLQFYFNHKWKVNEENDEILTFTTVGLPDFDGKRSRGRSRGSDHGPQRNLRKAFLRALRKVLRGKVTAAGNMPRLNIWPFYQADAQTGSRALVLFLVGLLLFCALVIIISCRIGRAIQRQLRCSSRRITGRI